MVDFSRDKPNLLYSISLIKSTIIPPHVSDARGELRYGEIDFWSFACLLEDVDPQPGEVFLDIGSGTGKAVYATRLLYSTLGLCFGIEIQVLYSNWHVID